MTIFPPDELAAVLAFPCNVAETAPEVRSDLGPDPLLSLVGARHGPLPA